MSLLIATKYNYMELHLKQGMKNGIQNNKCKLLQYRNNKKRNKTLIPLPENLCF